MRFLRGIFGSQAASRVLLYLQNYQEGYGAAIARTFSMPVSQITKQLEKFEDSGILVSRAVGRTRVFYWNERNPMIPRLRDLLASALENLPDEEIERYYSERTRPRKAGKPL